MTIIILSDGDSSHTQKWVKGLVEKKVDVVLFTVNKCNDSLFYSLLNVPVFEGNTSKKKTKIHAFICAYFSLRRMLKVYKPDIVHAHYASSYGLLAAITKKTVLFLSLWGSDVFQFPRKSTLHKVIFKYVLSKSDFLFSTSNIMKKEANLYTNKEIKVIPFGIDTSVFKNTEEVKDHSKFIIGTVKTLAPIYGIDKLIYACHSAKQTYPEIELHIYGSGFLEEELKALVYKLEANTYIYFHGKIANSEVPNALSKFDLFCNLSDTESFGVAVLEASSCEIPVLVTDVSGLQEVVENGVTGYLVKDVQSEINAVMLDFISSIKQGDKKYGEEGRRFVQKHYEWDICLQKMINEYVEIHHKK